ncbi:MAG: hypothetical protein COA96_18230 [SAR86 cluster bacterium]|uniref:MipA/OmpV family protein n=1 Tax=SAR86 cluster bacterium TaxID=2030880 RepID=A0A2A5AC09_9GAMM|nr:MAG: hypothetical protein COA96_18230 [SAR86 cluster bacterium]
MNKFTRLLGLSVVVLSATNTAFAGDAIGPGDNDATWIVGLSAISYDNVYAGEGRDSVLLPNISYNGETFFVKNGTFNYSLFQAGNYSFGLTGGFDGGFLNDVSEYRNNAELVGLEERDSTFEGGFYVNHTTDLGRFHFAALTDLGNKHDGESASLTYTFDLKAGNWNINPAVGVHWLSDNKVNHRYGVSLAEANVSRAAYEAGSAFNVSVGIRARYELTDHWDVNLQTGINFLDSSISNSSIVDDDNAYHTAISFNYNF